ncbi:MAG: tryptophan synthase subunit alpha [Acidobacteria bacterium]|nr:tryptophan synthase subunit alpha [Acidobacteriota bacterium]MCA1643355.1 tryptophan synthase subunit alpha [Acidobacteriota bacterium]
MSRIAETFARLRAEGRCGFVPFVTAGDPNLSTTRELVARLARAGADVVELGVPFSDPMADGVVIQRASERALRNNVSVADVLALVRDARRETDVPVVLFSYFNPLLQFGLERLCEEAKRAGVDGVLVTDLAPEEAEEFSASLKRSGLDMIFLVAPTSTDARLSMIAARASGFIYAVSRAGVTGAQGAISDEAEKLVKRVRAVSDLPVAVGFGISTREQVAEVWRYADAAVVGSALVAEIEQRLGAPDLVERVASFAGSLLPARAAR